MKTLKDFQRLRKWQQRGVIAAVVAVVLFIAIASASAQAKIPPPPQDEPDEIIVDAEATATATATGYGGRAKATTGEIDNRSTSDAQQSLSINEVHPDDIDLKIKNTPDTHNYTPGSGDDCVSHWTATLGIPGFGTGVGIPKSDKDCRILRVYDRQMDAGNYDAAAKTLCTTKVQRFVYRLTKRSTADDWKKCFDENAHHVATPPTPPTPPPAPTESVTVIREPCPIIDNTSTEPLPLDLELAIANKFENARYACERFGK